MANFKPVWASYPVKTYHFPDGKSANIGLTSELRLQCSVCPGTADLDPLASWCEHIEHCVKNHDDAELWWKATENTENANRAIQVPIFPTQSVWGEVVLGPGNPTVLAYPVYYRSQLSSSNDFDFGVEGGNFLGFFSKGEGLAVLRGMLWSYFTGHRSQINECSSNTHFFKEQMRWERIKKEGRLGELEAEEFILMDTGKCKACFTGATEEHDFSDVVPEGTAARTW